MIWGLIGRARSSRGPRFGFPMRIRTLLNYRGAASLGMEAKVLHLAVDPFLLFGKTGGGPMAEDSLLSWTCAWQEFQLTPTTLGALLVTFDVLLFALDARVLDRRHQVPEAQLVATREIVRYSCGLMD